MPTAPGVPTEPEQCPAPCQNEKDNPKAILGHIAGLKRRLSAEENWRIAAAMKDMGLVRTRCPASFAPFADEVEARIRPLFSAG
jgi:ABC-type transport system involved in cytochrome c biogenesis ATPase subunit